LRLAELELLDRERRATERRIRQAKFDVVKSLDSFDDWTMAPLEEAERRDFLEICDQRYQTGSTLLTSQLPVASWHAQIGDPTIADSILDRLVHNAHREERARRFRRFGRRLGLRPRGRPGRGGPPDAPHPLLRLCRLERSSWGANFQENVSHISTARVGSRLFGN